ncbi:MAG TPA: hypothetical protein VEQ60_32605 [Longimicrobium sp.]|nr:hypothetical protein [Longimicrobium sp.]
MTTRWMYACALAAGLTGAPHAAQAQRVEIALAVEPGEAGAAAASVDAFVAQSTAAMLRQVQVLTEPGRGLGNEIVDLPCDRQPQPAEMGIARMRPDAIVTAVVWRIRANQLIERLEQPLSVCFPANRYRPDRAYHNVIRFNSEWLARRGAGRGFVLSGYAQPGEAPATLGRDRAFWVRQESGANLQRRLVPVDAGCSDVPGEARWVHYVLSTERAGAGTTAATARPAACRRQGP